MSSLIAPPSSLAGTIDWGDGTSSSTAQVTVSGSQLLISGSHIYAEAGTYGGTVSGSYSCDGKPNSFSASFTAQVAYAPLTAASVTLPSLKANVTFTGTVATFIQGANPDATPADYSVTIV